MPLIDVDLSDSKFSQFGNVDPDAPLFPSGGDVTTTPASTTESGNTIETREEVPPTGSGNEPVTEQQVPYSRFRDAIEARREAERRAEEAEAREYAERERAERVASKVRETPIDFADAGYRAWAQIYGDNDNTRKAYAIELERQEALREEYRREAREAVHAEREYESRQVSSNIGVINERLEDFSLNLGRPISSTEESVLLDIVDEYTPVDAQGNYAGDLMSFEKAWEIMQMRQSQSNQRSSAVRRAPTALTSSRSQGETTAIGKAESDKNWNPRDWNSYKKRIPGL